MNDQNNLKSISTDNLVDAYINASRMNMSKEFLAFLLDEIQARKTNFFQDGMESAN